MRERRFDLLSSLTSLIALAFVTGALSGCEAPGVGAPCVPESVPEGGFDEQERYLETSSVQCRTRVCLVYELAGDPRELCEDANANPETCVGLEERDERVFCTCRCDAPTGNARECECPDGFSCQEILDIGSDGIRGGYCVRKSLLEDEDGEGGDGETEG